MPSMSNEQVVEMIKEKLMTDAGLSEFKKHKKNKPAKKSVNTEMIIKIPEFIENAFKKDEQVWDYFNKLAPSYKRNYIGWISSTKKQATREKRLKEAMQLLKQKKKSIMK